MLLDDSGLLLLGSLSPHLSFGLGLCLLLDALARGGTGRSSCFDLSLRSRLIIRLGLGATLLLLSHGLRNLLRSVTLGRKSLELLGIDLRHVNLLRLSSFHLLLDLDLLSCRSRLFCLALLRHLCLSLGFGLCLRLRDLLLREAGGYVISWSILCGLHSLIVGHFSVLLIGEHAHATERIELSQLHLFEVGTGHLNERLIVGLASNLVEVVVKFHC